MGPLFLRFFFCIKNEGHLIKKKIYAQTKDES